MYLHAPVTSPLALTHTHRPYSPPTPAYTAYTHHPYHPRPLAVPSAPTDRTICAYTTAPPAPFNRTYHRTTRTTCTSQPHLPPHHPHQSTAPTTAPPAPVNRTTCTSQPHHLHQSTAPTPHQSTAPTAPPQLFCADIADRALLSKFDKVYSQCSCPTTLHRPASWNQPSFETFPGHVGGAGI